MIQGEHYLEIHIDFDKLCSDEFEIVVPCICQWKHTHCINKDEVSLIQGVVITCPNCKSKVAYFSNNFKVKVNNS